MKNTQRPSSKGPQNEQQSITVKMLERFVKIRNKSSFNTNLQFQIDAETAGFDASQLPNAIPILEGFAWKFSELEKTLVESRGKLVLFDNAIINDRTPIKSKEQWLEVMKQFNFKDEALERIWQAQPEGIPETVFTVGSTFYAGKLTAIERPDWIKVIN